MRDRVTERESVRGFGFSDPANRDVVIERPFPQAAVSGGGRVAVEQVAAPIEGSVIGDVVITFDKNQAFFTSFGSAFGDRHAIHPDPQVEALRKEVAVFPGAPKPTRPAVS